MEGYFLSKRICIRLCPAHVDDLRRHLLDGSLHPLIVRSLHISEILVCVTVREPKVRDSNDREMPGMKDGFPGRRRNGQDLEPMSDQADRSSRLYETTWTRRSDLPLSQGVETSEGTNIVSDAVFRSKFVR